MVWLPYAIRQRIMNCRQVTAPQPVVIVEIGIAGRTRCTRTMALDAVHFERRASAFDGRLIEPFVTRQLFDRYCRKSACDRRATNCFGLQFLLELPPARPVPQTLGCAVDHRDRGIEHDIAQRPHNRSPKGEHPPAGHRCVEFFYAIPFMTDCLRAGWSINPFVFGHRHRP
ncbi:MAG: hypothetical protein RL481_690 [Pseudomonadota bacterium]